MEWRWKRTRFQAGEIILIMDKVIIVRKSYHNGEFKMEW